MRVIHRHQSEQMQLELSLSDDKLKLFAKVIPQANHEAAHEDELTGEILKVSFPDLIDLAVVRDVISQLRQGKGCEERRVAKGEAPVMGRDGKIVWLVRRFRPGGGRDQSRDLSDFYNLGLFENIEAGQDVARVYRPTAGSPGIDVLGKPLPCRAGKAVVARFDRSLMFKADEDRPEYQTLVAAVSGYAHEEGGKVSIKDTLIVSGNLDYEMGHIDFIGNVRIGGDVQKGFHIKARGSIEIHGSVLGENQLTSGASITVKGFHQGGDGTMVNATGSYSVGIAQGVIADVGGNIIVQREARDCSFRSSMAVLAPQGTIVGGVVWCVKGIEAKVLGNPAEVVTVVELRNELEVTPEFRRVEERMKKHEVALAALELHIGPYLTNRKRVPLLAAKFRLKITELINKYDAVQASYAKLQDALRKMREAKPPEEDSRVNVLGVAHAGVVLNTTQASLRLQESQKGPISFKPVTVGGEWGMQEYQTLQQG